MITEVKRLVLNQFSDGSNLLRSSKGYCRKVGTMGVHEDTLSPLAGACGSL